MEYHLEQHVAEFLGLVRFIVRLGGIDVFMGFFDKIGQQGLMRLLAVPRAAFRRVAMIFTKSSKEYFMLNKDRMVCAILKMEN